MLRAAPPAHREGVDARGERLLDLRVQRVGVDGAVAPALGVKRRVDALGRLQARTCAASASASGSADPNVAAFTAASQCGSAAWFQWRYDPSFSGLPYQA